MTNLKAVIQKPQECAYHIVAFLTTSFGSQELDNINFLDLLAERGTPIEIHGLNQNQIV